MIQIFQELGFVTIENGIMKVNKEAEKTGNRREQHLPKPQTNGERAGVDGPWNGS